MLKKKVVSLLMLVVLVIPFNAIAQQENANIASVQQQAYADAMRDAQNHVDTLIWGSAGCLFNIWAIAGAYIIEPSVPTARLIGKSPEYITFYSATYKDAVKHERVSATIGGCCIGIVTYGLVYVVLIEGSQASTPYYYRY